MCASGSRTNIIVVMVFFRCSLKMDSVTVSIQGITKRKFLGKSKNKKMFFSTEILLFNFESYVMVCIVVTDSTFFYFFNSCVYFN